MPWDPYSALQVRRDAGADEIRAAFLRAVKLYHPDMGDSADAERFRQVKAAYQLLRDTAKRRQFDAGLIDANGENARGGFGAGSGFPFNVADTPVPKQRQVTVPLSFREAVAGGVALADGVSIRYAAGVKDGDRKQLSGADSQPVDFVFAVAADEVFETAGSNIIGSLRATPEEAANGANLAIEGPYGPVDITLPPKCSDGDEIRVREQGVGRLGYLILSIDVTGGSGITSVRRVEGAAAGEARV